MAYGSPEVQFPALSPIHTAYGTVRRRRKLQMLNYMLLAVVVNVKCVAVRRQDLCGMLRPSTYDDDAVCVCV